VISNYKDWVNREPNTIKKTVPYRSIVPLGEGIAGDNVLVSSHIYDILKKRIEELENKIKKLRELPSYEIDTCSEHKFTTRGIPRPDIHMWSDGNGGSVTGAWKDKDGEWKKSEDIEAIINE